MMLGVRRLSFGWCPAAGHPLRNSLRSFASPSLCERDVFAGEDVGGFETRPYPWWGVSPVSFGYFPNEWGKP